MKNPKVIAVAYLVTGVVAIIGFSLYLWIGSQTGVDDAVLDWLGLGAGVVSVGIGVKRYRELGNTEPEQPPAPEQRRRIPRPKD